jgi:hypothetical protein
MKAGSAEPIFISGIRYKSIFKSGWETGLSINWILSRIKEAGGEPVMIKGHFIVLEKWFEKILLQSPWIADMLSRKP